MEQTNLQLGTIGQRLEHARRAKGVTTSEAGKETRILVKFIEAMEADDFGVLSAPVYAKSFIRMYARYLGLDAQELVDEYLEKHAPKGRLQLTEEVRKNLAAADQTVPDPAMESDRPRSAPTAGFFERWKQVILAGAGILVLLGIVLTVSQCVSDEEEVPSPASGRVAPTFKPLTTELPDLYLNDSGAIEVYPRGDDQ
jgi:cytoskeletal protein RodZ